jgi:hypothetical protein
MNTYADRIQNLGTCLASKAVVALTGAGGDSRAWSGLRLYGSTSALAAWFDENPRPGQIRSNVPFLEEAAKAA